MGQESLIALRNKKSYANYLFAEGDLVKSDFEHSLKVAFLRNYTIEMLLPVIKGEIALAGVFPEVYVGEYDNILQDVLQAESPLYRFQPDVICVALNLANLSPKLYQSLPSLTLSEIEVEKENIINYLKKLFAVLHKYSSATIVCHNFFGKGTSSLGILDLQTEMSENQLLAELNQSLYEIVRPYQDSYLVDLFSIVYQLGYTNAFDDKAWAISKNPFTRQALVRIGQEYGKYFSVLSGHIKKCIILDCDNTLWGGIVGEDGCSGIKLGHDYPGCCYQYLQYEILNLYHRGVLIALCSKNNEEDVVEVFQHNHEMVLSLEHIVAYEINWQSKADNIRHLAKRLNIGLDSMVFVDDSAFECNLIREQIPEVDVIQLEGDPSRYAKLIRECGMFNALHLTADDKKRNENYKAEQAREKLRENISSIEDYLESLNMSVRIWVNCQENIPRIAQMTQKTNQFNLTTQRYTDAKIKMFMENPNYDVLAISVEDKVSDLGIVGAIILKYDDEVAAIDTFLLSCRALGRHIEDVLFTYAAKIARKRNCTEVIGCYYKTKKNEQVCDLFDRLGLKRIEEKQNGDIIWRGKLEDKDYPEYIEVNIMKGEC